MSKAKQQTSGKRGRPKGSSNGGARALTKPELSRLLAVARSKSLRDYALIAFMVGTGARVSEPLTLSIGDVWVGGKVVDDVALDLHQTKSRKSRRLVLSKSAQKALKEYISAELEKGADVNRPLFTGHGAKRLNANYATQKIARLMSEAAIAGASSHSLRKTFAQSLLENCVSLVHIQKLLGHSSLSITQQYLSSTDSDLRKAVATLNF